MNFRSTVIFLFATCWSCLGSDSLGTEPSFRIIDYKPIGFRTQSLEISPSFNLGADNMMDSSFERGKRESGSGYSSLNTYASHYFRNQKKTADLELLTSARFSGTMSAGSAEQSKDINTTVSNQSSPNFNYGFSNSTRIRKYIVSNVFLEGAVSPSINHDPGIRSRSENASIYEIGNDSSRYYASRNVNKYRRLSLSSGLYGSIGMGWIADMTGAAIALHMTDCVSRLSGRSQKFSPAQLQDLALAIDRLRRRRIFDSRIANIESVDTLCQILASGKGLDSTTVRLAMEINDIWNYGFSQQRHYGKEFKITPTTAVYYYHRQSNSSQYFVDSTGPHAPSITAKDVSHWPKSLNMTNESYNTNYVLTYGAKVYAGFSNPYGRYFQLDGSAEVSGTMNTMYDSTYDTYQNQGFFRGTYPNATVKMSVVLSWFPTLRSTITLYNQLTGSGDFYFRSRTISENSNYNYWVFSQRRLFYTDFSSSLQTRYYLSPRCSYDIWGSLRYSSGTIRDFRAGMYSSSSSGLRDCNFSLGTNVSYALF
jgi:hypothetical protein